ncbi:LysM peptidoglycan-binding domain-containing protein [Streptomyces sp. NPDC091376]|uniref:LysM peptidoglycan-binding domain-containing protein n=1 Tax=Streptomyces sp. NPDC091376 TaxID=3365994 RepID=UPI00382801D6
MAYVNAMLVCTQAPMVGAVPFLFPPDKVQMTRDVQFSSHGSSSPNGAKPAGGLESFKKAEPLKINLSEVLFSGPETKPLCDQLLNWMSPGSGRLGQMVGGALAVKTKSMNHVNRLPVLTFQMGPPSAGFLYDVMLQSAQISFTRFNRTGIPIRARATLTLKEQPSLLGTLPTNPTSGGLPGRRTYTVTEGEDLVNLARSHYGGTSDWRRLADANGIDDPLRMRPGTTIYLPNPDEFTD